MEQYKAFFIFTISDDDIREALEKLLKQNCFERLPDQSTYALPLEEYKVKVQPVKAKIKQFCMSHLKEDDTAFFFESRMNQDRSLSAIFESNLMKDEL